MKLREYFMLTKSDRQVLFPLLGVAALALLILFLTGRHEHATPTPQGDSTTVAPTDTSPRVPYYKVEERRVERFAFDPNTADSTQLLRLGLQPWQVRNIYKYRAAGGVYRRKEDFARLYGLTVKQYRELEPFIIISPDYRPAATLFAKADKAAAATDSLASEERRPRYPVKLAAGETIPLNEADTTLLQRVPGIGRYYASRIVQLRERLGGYVSVDQLAEIDEFPMESVVFFTVDASNVRKVNVNALSLNELRRHPYINYYQARAITDYRRQHGAIRDLDDLRLLPDFPEEAIRRLRPYVAY